MPRLLHQIQRIPPDRRPSPMISLLLAAAAFAWSPVAGATRYRIDYGSQPGVTQGTFFTTDTQARVPRTIQPVYLTVTAIDSQGLSSAPSQPLRYDPAVPVLFQDGPASFFWSRSFPGYSVQSSTNLTDWFAEGPGVLANNRYKWSKIATKPVEFFRLKK